MNQQFKPAKQLIEIQKVSVDVTISSLIAMWEQTAALFEGATWLPEEGRKGIRQWVDMNKKACEGLKSAIHSSYSNLEKIFSS
jgi:hypothetical protein